MDNFDAAADSGEQRQALEADLTGLGIKDAAGAALTARLADDHGAGQDVPPGSW